MKWKCLVAVMSAGLVSGAAYPQTAAAPTDPQIAHIAYTAGVLDIEAGQQALKKSKNAQVRAFAEEMVRDHTAVNDQALALAKKLGVTPEAMRRARPWRARQRPSWKT